MPSTLSSDPAVIQRELAALRKKLKSASNGERHGLAVPIGHRERKLKRLGTDDALDAMNAAAETTEGKWTSAIDGHEVSISKVAPPISGRILIRVGPRTILRGTFECPPGVDIDELLEAESTFNGTETSDATRVFLDLD